MKLEGIHAHDSHHVIWGRIAFWSRWEHDAHSDGGNNKIKSSLEEKVSKTLSLTFYSLVSCKTGGEQEQIPIRPVVSQAFDGVVWLEEGFAFLVRICHS